MWIFIWILLLLNFSYSVSKLSFSSTHETKQLLNLEIQLADTLKSLPIKEGAFHDLLESIYPNSLLEKLKSIDPEDYASHPINAVNSAKRTGWEILQLMPWISNISSLSNITEQLPTKNDYYEACSSMSLLIEAYQLNLTDLCKFGNIEGHYSLSPLDWSAMTHMGVSAFNRGWYDIGITLIEQSLEVFKGTKEEYHIYQKELKKSKAIHDQVLERKGPFGKNHRTFRVPFNQELRKKKKYKKIIKSKESIWHRPSLEANNDSLKKHDSAIFHSQCRKSESSILFPHQRCYLVHNNDPFHKLAPFQMELLSESPFIVIFRQFMHEKEMDHFITTASGKLKRSRVGSISNTNDENQKLGGESFIRTSKQIWLQEETYNITHLMSRDEIEMVRQGTGTPPFPPNYKKYHVALDKIAYRVTQRIGRATKLNVQDAWSAEPYQIANYGLGGQYDLHIDAHKHFEEAPQDLPSRVNFENHGDRIATFMVYLKNVPQGGGTVFSKLDISTKSRRGDALFWINLLSNGYHDSRTEHGGCPVLVGSKWITNKWISSHVQMFIHPCPLTETSNQVIRPSLNHF